jgi:hypothetical protein
LVKRKAREIHQLAADIETGLAIQRGIMMRTYLFDASAAVDIYIPRNDRVSKAIQFIQVQKRLRKAKLFIPNICIAEVFNTFAKRRFRAERQQDVLGEASY